jgi:hypothetical protein
MAVTTIKWVVNKSNVWVYYQSHQDPDHWLVMPPNRALRTDYPWSLSSNVPWCANQGDFNNHKYLEIGGWNTAGRSVPGFYVWQHDRWFKDGDRVRYSTSGWVDIDNNWLPGGETVGGDRGFEIFDPVPRPPGPGFPFAQLRPSYPRPPGFEDITELAPDIPIQNPLVAEDSAIEAELVPGAPPSLPYKKLPMEPSFQLPTNGIGYLIIAWFCGPTLPNNQDYWRVHVYPDGRQPYPGQSPNVIQVAFRARTQSQKVYRIWTPSAGSYQVRDWDAVTNYWDRINWHTLNRNEILSLEKARNLGGEPLLYIDPADLFRVFGGKYIIFDWMRD